MNGTVFAEDIIVDKPPFQTVLLVEELCATNNCCNTDDNAGCTNHSHDWTLDSRLDHRYTINLTPEKLQILTCCFEDVEGYNFDQI